MRLCFIALFVLSIIAIVVISSEGYKNTAKNNRKTKL